MPFHSQLCGVFAGVMIQFFFCPAIGNKIYKLIFCQLY